MEETPRAFTRRTSIAYAPPPRVAIVARPLAPDAPCPTLFRYPGPCGLAAFFAGSLRTLGPRGDLLWMSARTWFEDSVGARHFGTLAVLQPLRFQPAARKPGIFIGGDRPLEPDDEAALVWLPPSLLSSRLPWEVLASAAEAAPYVGAAAARERGPVIEDLCLYLEELDSMRRSGAPGPGVPWLQVPVAERRRRLAAAGVAGVWTDAARAVA